MRNKEVYTGFISNGKSRKLFVSTIFPLYFNRIFTVFQPYTNRISTVLIILLFPFFLFSQPLDTIIARAMDNNLEARALQQEYEAALQRAPQVSQLPDPEVGLGIFALPVETRLGPGQIMNALRRSC